MSFWDATKTGQEVLDASGLRSEFRNERIELRDSIRQCCEEKISAGVTLTDTNLVLHARFLELVDNTLSFEIKGPADLPVLSTVMVSYYHEGKAHLFLSIVREFNPETEDHPGTLHLRMPEQLAVSQMRWTFRVPMEGISEFSIALRDAQGRVHRPTCRDLSFGGLKVEFNEYEDPGFEIGSRCELTMSYLGKGIGLDAEIRHRQGSRYGIYLPQAFRDGTFNPPELYRWIVNALEQRCYTI